MRKYIRNSINGKYKVKRRRRFGGKGKKSYRAGAGNKGTNASLGKKAIVGPVDEEDYHVKRHQSRGIIWEVGNSDQVTGAHGGYIIHGTVPELTVLQAIMLALVKSLMLKRGFVVSQPNDPVWPIDGAATLEFSIQYLGSASNITLTSTATTGTTTYADVAVDMASKVLGISANDAMDLNKWGNCFINNPDSGRGYETVIDLSVTKFKIDIASNLVYQNRSLSQEASGSTSNALDVAQDPLFEVVLTGKGTGPIGIPTWGTTNVEWNIDKTSGLNYNDFGAYGNVLSEPTKKTFYGVKDVFNTSLNPGLIKQSKLKSHFNFTLGRLLRYFRNWTAGANRNPNLLGKFRYLWFRKTIDLVSGDVQNYKIAFQHHFAVGVTCSPKRDCRTVPYVYKIQ